MSNNYKILGICLMVALSSLTFCSNDQSKQMTSMGYLKGKIFIGPLCAVESYPPNPACQPTLETYMNWPVGVFTPDKKEMIAVLTAEISGEYIQELSAGNYVLDLVKQHRFGKNLPAEITIEPNDTTYFDIKIDTGIR